MDIRKVKAILVLSFILYLFSGCSLIKNRIYISEMKIATAINENLMPVGVTDVLAKGTFKVFCWFKWHGAQVDTKIIARWYYVTDNIRILDDTFTIPRKEGSGSILLSMPENKILPAGLYRVELIIEKHTLKSLTFKVE